MSDIKVGQEWKATDQRPEYAAVVRVIAVDADTVSIQRVGVRASGRSLYPVRKAKRERFSGKPGGYKLVKDVAAGIQGDGDKLQKGSGNG